MLFLLLFSFMQKCEQQVSLLQHEGLQWQAGFSFKNPWSITCLFSVSFGRRRTTCTPLSSIPFQNSVCFSTFSKFDVIFNSCATTWTSVCYDYDQGLRSYAFTSHYLIDCFLFHMTCQPWKFASAINMWRIICTFLLSMHCSQWITLIYLPYFNFLLLIGHHTILPVMYIFLMTNQSLDCVEDGYGRVEFEIIADKKSEL